MIRCKNCKSIDIKINSLNFASRKNEGEPTKKDEPINKEYYCRSCSSTWFYDPKCEDLYNEYLKLKADTDLIVKKVESGVSCIPPYSDKSKILRIKEIAKDLIENYQHILDIGLNEWNIIFEDNR